ESLLPVMNSLSRVSQPALIVWGGKDRVLPVKHGYYGKDKIPNSRLEIFDGCGHIPFFERSDRFNRLVLDFLSE
ncbi:MAG TPA: alpha/beta hydrolase, partial [Thermodesulfobacteriota bacterium]|nr:alpha/beta hydrolase [Thermodesulfobacteriota bacterium]